MACRPDVVFHLAAVVSGEAEADVDKGYRANLDGTRLLLDALRAEQNGEYVPRVVVASSIAVFGAPFPDVIGDDEQLTPLTSYGTQKAIAELLLADYSRHGFVDGIALRLPTICVRPGAPNRAASGFFSSIIREPLNGREAVLPVSDDVRHWFASPRAATGFFLHAATLDTGALGHRARTHDAGRVGDRRRATGLAATLRRRRCRTPRPSPTGRDDRPHRRRLAGGIRHPPSVDARLRRRAHASTTSCASTSTTSSAAASAEPAG